MKKNSPDTSMTNQHSLHHMGDSGLVAEQAQLLRGDTLSHGFFTRTGGTSRGIYEGLNCGPGSDDDPLAVTENRMMVAASLSRRDTPVITGYQIHGNQVNAVDAPWTDHIPQKGDALVTKTPGLIIGVLTADCLPVLFYDRKNKIIAAAHAGWKGAKAGIIQATLKKMEDMGGDRQHIVAAIGPALAQKSYEVSADFYQDFLSDSRTNDCYFTAGKDAAHYQFNLPAYACDILKAESIAAFSCSNRDTYRESDKFFSYRRTTHQRESDYGRQISAIMLHG